ncbi:eukaryotic translation initiation factor 4E, partial [Thalassiosira pseudonana CCMP1335]
HPLQHEWVLWEHTGGGKKDANAWKESMKQLCAFQNIEDFWRYYNHIPRPSQIIEEYSLFKKGIEPEWGDPRNKTGGEWFWRSHLEGDVLDLFWTNLVLGVIGEAIEDPALGVHINGARVVDKGKNYPIFKIELWIDTKDVSMREKLRVRLNEII